MSAGGWRATRRHASAAGTPTTTRGWPRRAIAGQLVISRRTAESHVENILAKLGYTSRAQIAAWTVTAARSASLDPG